MQALPAMSQPPALAPGIMLRNRYQIEGYIGGGGFGHIYRARDTALGHLRAIKEAFYQDLNSRRQFQLEAEFLLNARHPNLVRGYSVFESQGRLYLVMDYVDGHTLEDIAIATIKRTHLPPSEAQTLDWILPICDAIQELHCQPTPIIHRDVKPANIKLSASQGAPVLIDLGLAKLYARGQQTITAALAFTPGYAPPEQYQATGATDQRTDVYGLGATLYYLLTGYQPVEAPARLTAQALPTPRERNARLSEAINDIVMKAMALDPNARYQTARELGHELALQRATLLGVREELKARAKSGRVCARCGETSPASARFCMSCGATLLPPTEAPAATTRPVVSGAHRGRRAAAPPQPEPIAPAAFVAPAPLADVAALPAWLSPLNQLPPPSRKEVEVSLSAVLSVIGVALSLIAPFHGVMLIFAPIALALATWSIAQWSETPAPREFHWLAVAAAVVGGLWLSGWAVHFGVALAHVHPLFA
ncbi:MAG TPA: serine/threonine-protein kinase [Ktedonobacterales bacterium]